MAEERKERERKKGEGEGKGIDGGRKEGKEEINSNVWSMLNQSGFISDRNVHSK